MWIFVYSSIMMQGFLLNTTFIFCLISLFTLSFSVILKHKHLHKQAQSRPLVSHTEVLQYSTCCSEDGCWTLPPFVTLAFRTFLCDSVTLNSLCRPYGKSIIYTDDGTSAFLPRWNTHLVGRPVAGAIWGEILDLNIVFNPSQTLYLYRGIEDI